MLIMIMLSDFCCLMFFSTTSIIRPHCSTTYVDAAIVTRDAPIRHWPIIGRPIIGA